MKYKIVIEDSFTDERFEYETSTWDWDSAEISFKDLRTSSRDNENDVVEFDLDFYEVISINPINESSDNKVQQLEKENEELKQALKKALKESE